MAKDDLKDKINNGFRSTIRSAKEKLEDTRDNAEKYVKDNPVKSTVIAAAIGAVVGAGVTLLMTRPRKRSMFDYFRDFI